MAEDEPFRINITVPLGYHRPFKDVVQDVASRGLNVQAQHPEGQSIHGLGNAETLRKLEAIPGIFVSRDDHEVTWRV